MTLLERDESAGRSAADGAQHDSKHGQTPSIKRQSRVKMQTAIDLHSETNFFAGFSANIGDGGVFIATVESLPHGTEVDLRFSLPSGEKIDAAGVVRWSRIVNDRTPDIFPGIGIQFTNLSEQAQRAIHKFVGAREPLFFAE